MYKLPSRLRSNKSGNTCDSTLILVILIIIIMMMMIIIIMISASSKCKEVGACNTHWTIHTYIHRRSLAGSMEKFLDSMVIVARGASTNVRMFPLTVLFTFTMVIIINCILGLITIIHRGSELSIQLTTELVQLFLHQNQSGIYINCARPLPTT